MCATSALVVASFVGTAAEARCFTGATTVTCDTTAPNPEPNGAIGADIRVLPGATVDLNDPNAGASVRDSTVIVAPGGALVTDAGSLIHDTAAGGTAVNAGAGATIDHSGTITARANNAHGVLLGQGSTLTVEQGGVVETLGNGSTNAAQNISAAVAVGGSDARIVVNGTVRSSGGNAPAITAGAPSPFGYATYPATVIVGATGTVTATGSRSTAIALSGGSTLSVAGSVSATAPSSNAITYRAGNGAGVTMTIAETGSVTSTLAAITGSGAAIDLTIAGTVSGRTTAVALGEGDDRITLTTTARVGGTIDGGDGSDALILTGNGAATLGQTADVETLAVNGGTWTLAGPSVFSGGISVASGAAAIGSVSVLRGNIVDNGTVVFDQPTDVGFTGSISGSGAVVKAGAGRMRIGTETYTGKTTVAAGTLVLGGTLASTSYQVDAGGTLTSGQAVTLALTGPAIDITNAGTITTTAPTGRAINIGGAGPLTFTLVNNAGGTISSGDDAVRISADPSGGAIRVDNYGTIQTTRGGQALDFDAIATGAASVTINNYAGGVLRSFGQDAIRPGQGAIVTNAGLIFADGATGNSYDGIDWQAHSGTLVNQPGGTISGLRHGVTSNSSVDVTNYGTILGRNGSGVGSDGGGTVVNYGTITGQWDGAAANGDGDGVDIDLIGTVRNFGTIQGLTAAGVDSGGRLNSAQGVAIGGGVVENAAGATILGGAQGVLVNHDTNPGGVADGATTITNAGTIRGQGAEGVLLVGDFADTITTSGLIAGRMVALDMGGGDDTLNIVGGAIFAGTVSGGSGNDQVTLNAAGDARLGATTAFETLAVQTGSWTLDAPTSYAGGITIAAPATLIGDTATLRDPIAVTGTLIFAQPADGTFTSALSGNGVLLKNAIGALTIGNQPGFTGRAIVNAGKLLLAGSLPAAVTVAGGATLGGTGTVGSLSILAGGIVAPGNSPGTINVIGAFAQAGGSTYAAETTAAGLSDRIVVGGAATIGSGASLAVTRDGGAYTIGTRYTLLTASGGISGTYTLVQTPTGGTELRLVQTGNLIAVDVARTAAALPSVAITANQAAVAPAFAALGVGNAGYAALTLVPDNAVVRGGFDALSGEIHATLHTAMLRGAQSGEDAVRTRLFAPAGSGSGVWAQATGQRGSDDRDSTGAARASRRGWAGFGGVDVALGDAARIGVAGGYTRTDLTVGARSSTAEVESTHALAYAGGTFGAFTVRAAGGYAWTRNDVRRGIAFPGFAALERSRYDGDVLHGFVEAGVSQPFFGGTVEPFVGVEAYRVHTDGFAESAGAVALNGRADRDTFTIGTLGLRTDTPIVDGLSARSRLGWQHVLGDRRPDATVQFAGGAIPFTVAGAALSRDAAAVALDLAWQPTQRVTITSGYSGAIGGAGDDSRLRVMVAVGF